MHEQEQNVRDDGQQERTGKTYGSAASCLRRASKGLFSSLLFSSLLFSSLLLIACTGTGGSVNSIGEVYNPDGSAVGSSGSGSSGSQASGSSGGTAGGSGTAGSASSGSSSTAISAGDLLNDVNSGRVESITARFPNGENEPAKTFFLNLSAEDFGVPEGGYMVLALDSDGFPPQHRNALG